MSTTGTRLVDLAERRGKLEAIAGEVERAERRLPAWRAGKPLRGLILARRGRVDEARALLAPIADPKQADPAPSVVRLVVGQEWEAVPALRPLALALYEGAIRESVQLTDNLFYDSPAQRLVEMYRVGRAARRRPPRAAGLSPPTPGRPSPTPTARRTGRSRTGLGDRRQADRASASPPTPPGCTTRPWPTPNPSSWPGTGGPRTTPSSSSSGRGWRSRSTRSTATTSAATLRAQLAGPSPVDPLLLVHPRGPEDATLASLLQAAIRSAARSPGGLDEARAGLARKVESRPDDLAARIALALADLEAGPPEAATPAIEALAKLVEGRPLERLLTRGSGPTPGSGSKPPAGWASGSSPASAGPARAWNRPPGRSRSGRWRPPPASSTRPGPWPCSASRPRPRSTGATAPAPRRP